MTRKRLFRCAECGGDVVQTRGPGRLAEYRRGVVLPIPDDFELPICAACGEHYSNVERSERLAKLQKPAYEAWLRAQAAKLIKHLQVESKVTLANLEYACGVTRTYFSLVQNGKRTPSLALVRLLEAFANAPAELARHRAGEAWRPAAGATVASLPVWAVRAREATVQPNERREVLTLPARTPAGYTSSDPRWAPAAPSNDIAA